MEEEVTAPCVTKPAGATDITEHLKDSKTLKSYIQKSIECGDYNKVASIFLEAEGQERREHHVIELMPEISLDLYHEVCLPNLNDETFNQKHALYCCIEELFKEISSYAPQEEFLLELIELIETDKSEHVFTTALKGLQKVLLRFGDKNPRALEWSFNSIILHLEGLKKPAYLENGYDEKQEKLLEQQASIQNILTQYVYIGYCLEPIVQDILNKAQQQPTNTDYPKVLNRRNLTICFLIQLLEGPLGYLDLKNDGRKTNSYSLACAQTLKDYITKLLQNPVILLEAISIRKREEIDKKDDDYLYELSQKNVFLIEEKLPSIGVGIYLYLLFHDEQDKALIPSSYPPAQILEQSLYILSDLLNRDVSALNSKGLLLLEKLLENLRDTPIALEDVKDSIYLNFAETLCNVTGYSSQLNLRRQGVDVLKKFILQFQHIGRYSMIKNLMIITKHDGIQGFLCGIYKDIVLEALKMPEDQSLPHPYCGKLFKKFILENVCDLADGVQTDMLSNADSITASLNFIRFFALKDDSNRTGFWSLIPDIEEKFLDPLRLGLHISMAHYKKELKDVEECTNEEFARNSKDHSSIINLSFSNKEDNEHQNLRMDRQFKIQCLRQNICNLELIMSLLGRANECISYNRKKVLAKTSATASTPKNSSATSS